MAKSPLKEQPSVSEVTAIEYNRWLVESEAKKSAEMRKQTHNDERKMRAELKEKYVTIAHDRSAQAKEQMKAAKAEVDNYHSDNLKHGAEVKEEVEALKKLKQAQKEQWLEHGSSLAREYGSEQKQRIKQNIGEMSSKKRGDAAAIKAGNTEAERVRTERKQKEVEDAQKLKRDILDATSDAVTREAKDTFFKQRKEGADDTRKEMKIWKDSRGQQKEAYANKAAGAKREVRAPSSPCRSRSVSPARRLPRTCTHRQIPVAWYPSLTLASFARHARIQALAAKKAAKEALESVRKSRAEAAKQMRDKRNNISTSGGKVKSDVISNKKVVHDMTRSRKYVSPAMAAVMKAQ